MIQNAVKDKLDTIVEAIEDVRNGKPIIVVDDEDRENEGDFIVAARHVTPEIINFMTKQGRGLICVAVTEDICDKLGLEMMVSNNTDPHKTAFTVSVDLLGHGCTTGISAHDRSKTVMALINSETKPSDFARPGHIFPLKAKNGGVLRRTGHTEAAVDLARLAGLEPAGAIVEIMNDDGTMARLPQLMEIAEKFEMKVVSIRDLIAFRLSQETLVEKVTEIPVKTAHGDFKFIGFRQTIENKEYIALVKGSWEKDEIIPVRVHSCNIISDIFNTLIGNTGAQLDTAMRIIESEGKGVIVYINHLQPGVSLLDEMKEISSRPTSSSSQMDSRDFGIGAQILRSLGVSKMNLITSHPNAKRSGLDAWGLEISGYIELK
jgi:3,4-dihydroxy 2-butanone 4-phosphate synthase / GTP cyclohydrolase II